MISIALLVLAAPLSIEPLGFTVERAGDEVTVTKVAAGSPAEQGRLMVGDVITSVSMPMRVALRKPFSQLSDEDLVLTLTPPHGEQLVVSVKNKGTRVVVRTDAPPADRFPEIPLPAEKLKRLTVMEQSLYYAALSGKMNAQTRAARPTFALGGSASVTLGGAAPKRVIAQTRSAASTPEWVSYQGSLQFHCESSPMTGVEFRATPPRTLSTGEGQLHGGVIQVELPLWRTKDVLGACEARELRAEVPLTLSCAGVEPKSVTLTTTLQVTCDANAQAAVRLDGLRVTPARLQVGDDGRVEAKLWWHAFVPAPKKVRVVQVFASGKTEALADVPVQKSGETKTVVTLPTKTAAVLELAAEVEFADRSIDRSPSQRVRVMSKEEVAADKARTTKATANFSAIQDRLKAKWPDPCAEPAKVVAWLKEQPEVTIASLHDGDFSYVIDFIPIAVHCH